MTDLHGVFNLLVSVPKQTWFISSLCSVGTSVPCKEYSNCIMQVADYWCGLDFLCFVCSQVSPSRPGVEGLNKMVIVQDSISNKGKGHADYDSGNDTSSPPSSKTGITKSKVFGNRKFSCQDPEKLRPADRDTASDSGHSLTSYDSLSKPLLKENTPHSSVFNPLKGWGCFECILHQLYICLNSFYYSYSK